MPSKPFLLLFFFLLIPFFLLSQNREKYILKIKKASNDLVIDGVLDEPDWLSADIAKDFFRVLPIDTGYASAKTEVIMTYNAANLYIGITCYQGKPGANIVESLRRDFSFGKNDNFLLFMDPYNDHTNGFSFGASAAGAQWDGLQANGGFVNLDWDCKWVSEAKEYEDRWVVEMSIPFKNLRYKEGLDNWGINFSRLDLKMNEKSSWAPVPRQFQTASLAFTGTLQWDEPPPKPGLNYSIIPYVSNRLTKDYQNNTAADNDFGAGFDARVSLSSTMNLDLTINPDFSQVEVDRQVTNLDRFELFFPERRRFFLENKDIFTDFGADGVRPFFSRRIGLNSPVRTGIKLSGRLNKQWRVGLLNMQTGKDELNPAANFTVASVQRQLFKRSNLGFIFVNKQLTQTGADTLSGVNLFNRVAGLDFNLASADNRWTGKSFFHQSFSPEKTNDDYIFSNNLVYSTGNINLGLMQTSVGENYQAEVGFVRRKAYHRFNPTVTYKFFPGVKNIDFHGPIAGLDLFYNKDFRQTDRIFTLGYQLRLLDRSNWFLVFDDEYVELLADFDPTNANSFLLPKGSTYRWQTIHAGFISDARKLFSFDLAGKYGGFYNGDRFNLEGNFIYRFQPFGSLALNFSYNHLEFPSPYESVDFFLIGPKLDVTFTDKIFLTTFIQYNNQIDNINMNIRFQWRYQPVSDLFIVYTDNYFPDHLKVKNRAIVAKLSYWFN